MSYVSLTPLDLALSATLILINAALSWGFRLGLEKSLVIASLRMVVQLLLIGLVLKFVFAATSPLWTLIGVALGLVVAGYQLWELAKVGSKTARPGPMARTIARLPMPTGRAKGADRPPPRPGNTHEE